MDKKSHERTEKKVLQKVLQTVATTPIFPAGRDTDRPSSQPRQLRQKLWNFVESPIVWGAITLLLAAIGSVISSFTLFLLTWFLGTAAVLKEKFFEGRTPTKQAFGNSFLCLVLAAALLTVWRTFPKPREIPTPKEYGRAVIEQLPAWLRSGPPHPTSAQKALSDPVLHLEPGTGVMWSTGPKQTPGVFAVALSNTGTEDVDTASIEQEYFVAERNQAEIVLKRLGRISVLVPHLKSKVGKAPLAIDFRPYTETAREVMLNFGGPSLVGVKISVDFRRQADGKDFGITFTYGALNPTAPAMYAPKSQFDSNTQSGAVTIASDGRNYSTDSINAGLNTAAVNRGRIALSDVLPYLNHRNNWIPVTKEISVDSNGKQTIRQF